MQQRERISGIVYVVQTLVAKGTTEPASTSSVEHLISALKQFLTQMLVSGFIPSSMGYELSIAPDLGYHSLDHTFVFSPTVAVKNSHSSRSWVINYP